MNRVRRGLLIGLLIAIAGTVLYFSPWGMQVEEELGLAMLFKIRGPRLPPDGVVIVNLDQDPSSRLGLPDKPALGIVATLRDWKGHDYLFDALAPDRAGWANWQVIVVGDGPYRDRLEARLARLGLAADVRLVGQQQDVVPWLQALDLFTLPSYGEEGVPQAIMQAMACGLPVVSTPVGAITEAVAADVTGLVVAPRDAAALGAGLARLRGDAALRRRFGSAARERALARFGLAAMLDRMEQVFRMVLERR